MGPMGDKPFYETYKSAYPYATLHASTCGSVRNATRGDSLTLEEAAGHMAGYGSHPDTHDRCLPPEGEAYTTLRRAAWAIDDKRRKAEARHRNLEVLALAKAVIANLDGLLGDLSAEESAELANTVTAIRSGRYQPRVGDLRAMAVRKTD